MEGRNREEKRKMIRHVNKVIIREYNYESIIVVLKLPPDIEND